MGVREHLGYTASTAIAVVNISTSSSLNTFSSVCEMFLPGIYISDCGLIAEIAILYNWLTHVTACYKVFKTMCLAVVHSFIKPQLFK